jgi:3-hydroxybutyrate dehydrogenase
MTHLKGKVAVVTGSTSGIGLGMATEFARHGASILMNGLGDAAAIEKTRAQMEKDTGAKVIYHGADMTKPDQIEDMIKTAKAQLGGVDILVNNAGIQHVAPIDEFPPEQWEAIININLVAAFHTLRFALPIMKEKSWGRIINTASAHALVASPFKSAYVAAKHGLAGLTKTVAIEVAEKGITCNAICPGYVDTPLVRGQIADTAKAKGMSEADVISKVMLAEQPTKQFVTVDQIAGLALFLTTDAATNITGAMLSIDGGWTAH